MPLRVDWNVGDVPAPRCITVSSDQGAASRSVRGGANAFWILYEMARAMANAAVAASPPIRTV